MIGQDHSQEHLRALLVDPAVFTGPYDAALTGGLVESDVVPAWATRASKAELNSEIPPELVYPIYYPGVEGSAKQARLSAKLKKGVSHVASTRRLMRLCENGQFQILHFQWLVLPLVDLLAIKTTQPRMPIVLTVHDSTPFNGNPTSKIQGLGYNAAMNAVDHIIVHTTRAKENLVADGISSAKISVIPHGPLPLKPQATTNHRAPRNIRWTYVLFGRLQDYKGLDTLVDALAQIGDAYKGKFRVIVAGESMMDTDALRARAQRLGLADVLEWRTRRLTEPEMADLFEEADSFIFPYKRIDASGVYYTIKGYRKWVIASDLGAFSDEISQDVGRLFPAGDAAALAKALVDGIGRTPSGEMCSGSSWNEIGKRHAALYESLLTQRAVASRRP